MKSPPQHESIDTKHHISTTIFKKLKKIKFNLKKNLKNQLIIQYNYKPLK